MRSPPCSLSPRPRRSCRPAPTKRPPSSWEPVHEGLSAALSVGLAFSRTIQYAPRARPPSALHLALPEQAPAPRVVNPARLTGTPEWSIAVSGFFLNFFWEMAQSAWYADVARKTYQEILVSRLHCTLGDVVILLVASWITAWPVRDRYWVTALRSRDLAAFTGLGLGDTPVSEWVN